MTPKKINSKIAEIIGWKPKSWSCDDPECEDCSHGNRGHKEDPPDFYRSLDACRLFEKSLQRGDIKDANHPRYMYSRILYTIVPESIQLCMAPAKYRAKAFLEMIKGLKPTQIKTLMFK